MPVFRHRVTGQEAELTPDYVSAFGPDTWEQVADEGPNEKADRELKEAIANKVEIEGVTDVEVPAAEVDSGLLEKQRQAVIALNAGEEPAAPKTSSRKSKKSAEAATSGGTE